MTLWADYDMTTFDGDTGDRIVTKHTILRCPDYDESVTFTSEMWSGHDTLEIKKVI